MAPVSPDQTVYVGGSQVPIVSRGPIYKEFCNFILMFHNVVKIVWMAHITNKANWILISQWMWIICPFISSRQLGT